MTPQEFIAKWQRVNLSERSACQQHFLDLCELLGQPKPAAADPDGAWYTFEKGVRKTDGGQGWADVWMKDRFGWEYKGKHKDLRAAFNQLQLYRNSLENPPLLVVSDMDRFEVHTNFTGTAEVVHAFDLAGLADPANLDILRKVFTDPEALKPGQTTEAITDEASKRFGVLADNMRDRGVPAEQAAHFLMKLMFCMFAEDIELLPKDLFKELLRGARYEREKLTKRLKALFEAMCKGGDFGKDEIAYFNGGLFADSDVVQLLPGDVEQVLEAAEYDWSYVEPSVFGTLFERTLDPSKRSQIGAHYTSRTDIETLVEPVMMKPLRDEWAAVKAKAERLWEKVKETAREDRVRRKDSKERRDFDKLLQEFQHRLTEVKVLDPACGSGNFLYVALNLLMNLEKEVVTYAAERGASFYPLVKPTQLHGIEINPYAQQLAQVVIWIGYLQWMLHNGFSPSRNPVLDPIQTIEQKDAIIDPATGLEPEWPAADIIVGNPPFLGGKLLRANLGGDYVDRVFVLWRKRVRPEADICCYWFEKARAQIERGKCRRAGLLATQGIRGGANREVLKRIKETGDIFWAESDREWILDGANVHVSMIAFDAGDESRKSLDGSPVEDISAQLSSGPAVHEAYVLRSNAGVGFMGITPAGEFDCSYERGIPFLLAPNPNGLPNSDVVRPYLNGKDLNQRLRHQWTVDFGIDREMDSAAGYERPFEYINEHVRPERQQNNREAYRRLWWLYAESRPAMRSAIGQASRYLGTCMVAKHRLFVWIPAVWLPANVVIAFARSDDYFFGVLHSRVHELWARAQGTQLRERESGFRYTPTTCFETFPFPVLEVGPAEAGHDEQGHKQAIAAAAKELDSLRNNWLNPPEWTTTQLLEFPGSVEGPWKRYVHDTDSRGIGTVRYPRIVAKDADCADLLKKRTLTNLYNERPTWLALAHQKLDETVFAAYGWDPSISDEELLAKLLALNLERAANPR